MRELARDDYARRRRTLGPLAGFSERTTGVPAVTVNRLLPVATSLPVVTVTLLAPKAAVGVIVKVAVRWVASVTTMALAVTPGLLNVTAGVPRREMRELARDDYARRRRTLGPARRIQREDHRSARRDREQTAAVATSLPVVTVTLLAPRPRSA